MPFKKKQQSKKPLRRKPFKPDFQHWHKTPQSHQVLGALMVLGYATPDALWRILYGIQRMAPYSSLALRSKEDVLAALHVLHNHGLARPSGTWGTKLGDTWEVLLPRPEPEANGN